MPFFLLIGTMMSGVLLLFDGRRQSHHSGRMIAVGVIGSFSQLKQKQTRRP